MAKDGKPENLAASTARLFLGLRLECAQCHDHPFASGSATSSGATPRSSPASSSAGEGDAFFQVREVPDRRELAIPGTDKVVAGRLPRRQRAASGGPRSAPASILADWMTAPDNPYFARAAVNRVWAQFFGTGLVDPVDDMGAENPPSHPELLDELAAAFAAHGFDLKFLIRAIVASRPYQLTSRAATRRRQDDPRLFARMPVRGLTPSSSTTAWSRPTGLPPRSPSRAVRLRQQLAPQGVPRKVRRPGREADRAPDVDPPGADADERPAVAEATSLEQGRDPAGRRRAPTSSTRRARSRPSTWRP